MKLDKYHNVYFIGIGGIGMSALARWFNHNGFAVSGYDRTPTSLTNKLIEEGIAIHFDDDVANIPDAVKQNKEESLIIITPAIPKHQKELNYFKDNGFELFKRSQVLGMISSEFHLVAVAGTHGKTTTSSMIAHLLKHAGRDITAFLGGIATNYESNYIANQNKDGKSIAVVEADEFDRSFLTLHPDVAVVTSADADHLDIYGDKTQLEDSFKAFIKQVKASGKLFINEKIAKELVSDDYNRSAHTYGINRGQFFASNITMCNGFFEFNYCDEQCNINNLMLGVPGFHNVENATVAIAVALDLGLSPEEVRAGIESYRGVKRRFEYIIKSEKIIFVDDYAHHPTEIESFLKSLKFMYPDKKVTAIFQPHLFTRTRDFVDGFAESLDLADEVILLDIYPAREEPIEGVTSKIIYDKMQTEKVLINKEELLNHLENENYEVIATIGAGDIDKLVEPIKEHLNEKYHA
ncbi:UDP-N-acetylmuramate--L-alanine ligase [Fulvivirga lutea]|uniref:UDP-N-acetylmuramate--L-alanine ligase n=1 Tax=Fulvivirga lutea TaxID=2810512 RepID=A0A974WI86_9BACT|nr:UDP-N-acetylmuramate--L-alanine ligase [Fulvivirga lutea]QSE99044.1 UDP-N-acetylmuramate--L-alanine ligase [Fulvivirga lutea]